MSEVQYVELEITPVIGYSYPIGDPHPWVPTGTRCAACDGWLPYGMITVGPLSGLELGLCRECTDHVVGKVIGKNDDYVEGVTEVHDVE